MLKEEIEEIVEKKLLELLDDLDNRGRGRGGKGRGMGQRMGFCRMMRNRRRGFED
jgi:hypothetical protein